MPWARKGRERRDREPVAEQAEFMYMHQCVGMGSTSGVDTFGC